MADISSTIQTAVKRDGDAQMVMMTLLLKQQGDREEWRREDREREAQRLQTEKEERDERRRQENERLRLDREESRAFQLAMLKMLGGGGQNAPL